MCAKVSDSHGAAFLEMGGSLRQGHEHCESTSACAVTAEVMEGVMHALGNSGEMTPPPEP